MLKTYRIMEGKFCDGGGDAACNILMFTKPDDAEKKHLINDLKLDEHTLNSCLDPDELARLEFEPSHAAIIVKRPKNYSAADRFLFKVDSMGLFLFSDKLVMVGHEDLLPLEGRYFHKISSLQDLALKIIYRITLHYLEHLKVITMIADDLETKVVKAMENRHLLNLFTLEKGMVFYHNAIHSNGVVIEKLKSNGQKIGFSVENMEYLDDLIIENNQCLKQAEIFTNIFASLMDARASVVNNNLNVLMKTLNLIMIAIMVPSLVVSLFSMNVHIPMAGTNLAFWIILGLAGFSAGLVALLWKLTRGK